MQLLCIFLIILVVGLLLLLLFVCPSFKKRNEMKELSKFLYAHRGLHGGDVIENTLTAFKNAVDNNYGIELDVRLSEDRNVIVFHDDSTKRAFGIDKPIEAFAYYQILRLGLFGTQEKVPLFIETLNLVDGKVPLIVELKACAEWQVLCRKTAFLLDRYEGAFTVQSFDPLIVDWFKNHRPDYIRGLLMYPYKTGDYGIGAIDAFFTRNMFPNLIARPQYIAYDCNERNRFGLNLMTKLFKLPEVSWTVRSQEKMDECLNDNSIIIFEGFTPVRTVAEDSVQITDEMIIAKVEGPKEEAKVEPTTEVSEETVPQVEVSEEKQEEKPQITEKIKEIFQDIKLKISEIIAKISLMFAKKETEETSEEVTEQVTEELKSEEVIKEIKEEPKVEEVIEEIKKEPKVEEIIEEIKEEPNVEEIIKEIKEEPKIEEIIEEVTEEPKVEEVIEEVTEEPKVEEIIEEVKEEPKVEEIIEEVKEDQRLKK